METLIINRPLIGLCGIVKTSVNLFFFVTCFKSLKTVFNIKNKLFLKISKNMVRKKTKNIKHSLLSEKLLFEKTD